MSAMVGVTRTGPRHLDSEGLQRLRQVERRIAQRVWAEISTEQATIWSQVRHERNDDVAPAGRDLIFAPLVLFLWRGHRLAFHRHRIVQDDRSREPLSKRQILQRRQVPCDETPEGIEAFLIAEGRSNAAGRDTLHGYDLDSRGTRPSLV